MNRERRSFPCHCMTKPSWPNPIIKNSIIIIIYYTELLKSCWKIGCWLRIRESSRLVPGSNQLNSHQNAITITITMHFSFFLHKKKEVVVMEVLQSEPSLDIPRTMRGSISFKRISSDIATCRESSTVINIWSFNWSIWEETFCCLKRRISVEKMRQNLTNCSLPITARTRARPPLAIIFMGDLVRQPKWWNIN